MARILLLVDQPANHRLLADVLSLHYQVLPDGEAVLNGLFDLAIVDGPALFRLSERILTRRAAEQPVILPFMLLSRRRDVGLSTANLWEMVDDLLIIPAAPVELSSRVNILLRMRNLSLELKRQYERADRLSVTDDVSGFYNTRFLYRHLSRLLTEARTSGAKVSLVFFDMDRFKTIVDTYGHPTGSKVLREVAELVNLYLDEPDRIVRYGGDEYVLILPNQDKKAALAKTEEVRQGLNRSRFCRDEGLAIAVTASFGVATFPDDASSLNELLARADKSLFASKRAGRNRITGAAGQGLLPEPVVQHD